MLILRKALGHREVAALLAPLEAVVVLAEQVQIIITYPHLNQKQKINILQFGHEQQLLHRVEQGPVLIQEGLNHLICRQEAINEQN
jgi:hypothetical protein